MTQAEFNSILRALRGTLRDDQKPAAVELGNALSVLKAKQWRHIVGENDKLIENLRQAGLWDDEDEQPS